MMTTNDGGSKNIKAIKDSFDVLKKLGLNAEQIVQIAANGGGSKNIEAIKDGFGALKELGLNAEQIVKIAANDGGSKNILKVKEVFKGKSLSPDTIKGLLADLMKHQSKNNSHKRKREELPETVDCIEALNTMSGAPLLFSYYNQASSSSSSQLNSNTVNNQGASSDFNKRARSA